jgi:hypothetical protein
MALTSIKNNFLSFYVYSLLVLEISIPFSILIGLGDLFCTDSHKLKSID